MDEINDQTTPAVNPEEGQVDSTSEDTDNEEETTEDTDYKALYEESQNQIKDLTGKLKRATKPKSEPKKESKNINNTELDWGQKAYLKTEGINSAEFNFVQEQLESSNLPLEDLLQNNYFKSQLQEFRDKQSVAKAVPGNTRSSTKSTQADPEYWIDKPFSEVPDDMKRAVLNKKLERDEGPKHSGQKIIYGGSN